MKKILLTLTLVLSVSAFADRNEYQENNLEMSIIKNHSVIRDGAKEIGIKDLDVDMGVGRARVEIELYEGTGNISASALDKYAREVAEIIKKDLGNNNQVYVIIEVDREMLGDKVLLRRFI
ncbi:MAG: hypothetical protein ACRC0S_07630 [Fusobacteriaceae bacterium]